MARSNPGNCEPVFNREFEIERACAVVAAGVAYAMLDELKRIRREASLIERARRARSAKKKSGTIPALPQSPSPGPERA